MLLIRRFEEKAGQMYGMGLIGGFCHLYIGQEAVVTGITMARQEGRRPDHRLPRPRPHAGDGPRPQGRDGRAHRPRRAACRKGKGGSMHMFSNEHRFYGGNGIVGAQVSLGTGLAFAAKYQRRGQRSSLTYFGDGAANQGQVYESFNMAKLWNLPVVYIIENNRYAMGTSVERASAQHDFSKRGIGFDIQGEQVDGMDVRLVQDAADRAIAACARGQGPLHPRDDDLPLSRPLDVRPGEVPQQGRGHLDARRARPDRAGQEPHPRDASSAPRTASRQIETEIRAIVTEAADFATADARAGCRPSSGPTFTRRHDEERA